MSHVSYSEFRRNLASHMDAVCDAKAPLTVTRQGGRSVVVMAEDEYESVMETLHLLRSPRNAERLLRSIAQAEAGEAVERTLVEE